MARLSIAFVSWEERVISQEKGKRVVQYILKNACEEKSLAVVGTETSVRHMLYVIADEFHQLYGSYHFVNPSTKWRARRDVVQWLTSMVTCNSRLGATEMGSQIVDVSELQSPVPDSMIGVTRRLKTQGSGIVWSGTTSTSNKQLRHYPAFCKNETIIPVHSFVFVTVEGKRHYVGYLVNLYADERGNKKANVRRFRHNREVSGVIPNLEFDPREIFITPHVQAISVDCIEGFAIVLTPTHYEKCLAVVSLTVSTQVHMCSRQMVDNYKLKPFSVSTLHGYTFQPILACIDWPHTIDTQLDTSEVKKPAKKLKIKLRTGGNIDLNSNYGQSPEFKPGQMVEVLSQDSGIRGCWFRCKVLKASPESLKVQYVDVLDPEDSTNLEECIWACRVAAVDKLGMRCSGRPTIRPYPTPKDSVVSNYEIGSPVDAWWCDAWWEGFVVGGLGCQSGIQVYSPGEKKTLTVQVEELRISRDWIGDKWVDIIMANKDLLACISSNAKPKTVSNILEGVDENVAVTDLLKPLQIGDGDTKVNIRGDSGAGKKNYLGLS